MDKKFAAERAALKRDDVMLSINGTPIHDAAALKNMISMLPIGSHLNVEVLRVGKTMHFAVELTDISAE